MQCELCGNECGERGKLGMVDNVKMMLCPSCFHYGKGVKEVHGSPVHVHKTIEKRIRRHKVKDVYDGMNVELISDYSSIIKSARKKKGLTREQLGFNIGEPTGAISKIENGELRPSDKVAKKLEKELSISLFEEVKKVSPQQSMSASHGLTLGDFIKNE
jgi:putative transcription factor